MELLERQEVWNITYRHALGETASWFYTRIRDDAQVYGRRCGKTGRVLVPPRAFSDQTLLPTTDWVKVGPGGRIEAFTSSMRVQQPARSALCLRLCPAGRRGYGAGRLFQRH